mmetsp:Transcript_44508/g.107794  ORF Transcript_44508/g.107794 Transcript_44508/m.107794 type:complete len:801 (+) Transcript_44508:134-2536(+)
MGNNKRRDTATFGRRNRPVVGAAVLQPDAHGGDNGGSLFFNYYYYRRKNNNNASTTTTTPATTKAKRFSALRWWVTVVAVIAAAAGGGLSKIAKHNQQFAAINDRTTRNGSFKTTTTAATATATATTGTVTASGRPVSSLNVTDGTDYTVDSGQTIHTNNKNTGIRHGGDEIIGKAPPRPPLLPLPPPPLSKPTVTEEQCIDSTTVHRLSHRSSSSTGNVNGDNDFSSSSSSSRNVIGASYHLVASSHSLDRNIFANETVSFILYQNHDHDDDDDDDDHHSCSIETLTEAETIRRETVQRQQQQQQLRRHSNDDDDGLSSLLLPSPPLRQSAFLQVHIDQRLYPSDINKNDGDGNVDDDDTSSVVITQTRRTEIDVVEVAPRYFFFSTQFEHSSSPSSTALAVLSFEVQIETKKENTTGLSSSSSRRQIPLDTIGSNDKCSGPYDYSIMNGDNQTTALAEKDIYFRYEVVTRFGVWIEKEEEDADGGGGGGGRSFTKNTSTNDKLYETLPDGCDYSTGKGEWVYQLSPNPVVGVNVTTKTRELQTALEHHRRLPPSQQVLDEIANGARSKEAFGGYYRLFSCSKETFEGDFQSGLVALSKQRTCSLGDSNFARMFDLFRTFLPDFQHRDYFFYNSTAYYMDLKPMAASNPPTCMDRGENNVVDIIFHSIGSHCDALTLSKQAEAFEMLLPDFSNQVSCFVGADELAPYAMFCPAKFGNYEKLVRNVWRVFAKNYMARKQYTNRKEHGDTLVAALGPMGLSARDVSMTMDDCVHYHNQTPFPVYKEMVKFLIALAGRDCAK